MYYVMVPGVFSNTPAPHESWPDALMSFGVCQTTDGLGKPLSNPDCPPGVQESTRYSIKELREQFNYIDYSEGIIFRQVRAKPSREDMCMGQVPCLRNTPFPEKGDTEAFGFRNNKSFVYWTQEELGTPTSQLSPSSISTWRYDGGGFIAIMIPFFTDKYLETLVDVKHDEIPYRLEDVRVTRTNQMEAVYYCIRTSINGIHISQICDGNRTHATNTNKVYDHSIAFLDRLKVGHWMDFKTRFVQVEMQILNPNGGVAFHQHFIFELPAQGGVLPSTNSFSMPVDEHTVQMMIIMANIVLVFVFFYIVMNIVQIYMEGPTKYLSNIWNWMDWCNFVMFMVSYAKLMWTYTPRGCTSKLCREVGMDLMWYHFQSFMMTKQAIGINSTLQLLKIIQFTNVLFPPMSLLSRVLENGAKDLTFFAFLFGLSMVAFSTMFYTILGANMASYYDSTSSLLALSRALFGDFDMDAILDNSPDHLNATLFLLYLFVAVFILLSMFLAILADAQASVVMPVHKITWLDRVYGYLKGLVYPDKPAAQAGKETEEAQADCLVEMQAAKAQIQAAETEGHHSHAHAFTGHLHKELHKGDQAPPSDAGAGEDGEPGLLSVLSTRESSMLAVSELHQVRKMHEGMQAALAQQTYKMDVLQAQQTGMNNVLAVDELRKLHEGMQAALAQQTLKMDMAMNNMQTNMEKMNADMNNVRMQMDSLTKLLLNQSFTPSQVANHAMAIRNNR